MELNSEKREKYEKYTHVKFIEIYNYLSDKTYPEHTGCIGLTDKAWSQISEKLARISKLCTMSFGTNANERMVYNDGKFLAWLKY